MKKAARIVASLILAGAMASVAMAGFEFHGYGRAGVLLNGEGAQAGKGNNDGGVFTANSPAAPFLYNIGRLGNETNNYLEMELTNTFKAGQVGAATKVRLASKEETYTTYPENKADTSVFVRELYTEFSNLPFAPKAQIWAGKRFYGRDDIHINDFYWRIMDGTGAGISNIPAGPGVLDIAWICTTNEGGNFPDIAKKGQLVQKNLDVRYKGIKALGGEFEVELTPAFITDPKSAGAADSGIQGAVVYSRADFFGGLEGSSKVAIQYGTGAGAELGGASGTYMGEDATALRAIAWGVANIGENLKVSPSIVYEKVEDLYGKNNPDSADWLSLTVRPQYNFTRNLALQVEGGYGTGKTWNGDGSLMKLTIAPTLTLDNTSFWTRPQLRAFVTFASWDSDFKNKDTIVKDLSMMPEDSGMTYGVQMETWF